MIPLTNIHVLDGVLRVSLHDIGYVLWHSHMLLKMRQCSMSSSTTSCYTFIQCCTSQTLNVIFGVCDACVIKVRKAAGNHFSNLLHSMCRYNVLTQP